MTSNTDACSKSPGVMLAGSAHAVESGHVRTGAIASPTDANACARRLQQMKRVAVLAAVPTKDLLARRSGRRKSLRPSCKAWAWSYSLPMRLVTHSARLLRFLLSRPAGRKTRTFNASNSESRIDRTPAAMSASTIHLGSCPSSSGPTYIETCDHGDPSGA
jgi:hypothetical protein